MVEGQTSKETDNDGGSGCTENELFGKELSGVHAFTSGGIALGKTQLMINEVTCNGHSHQWNLKTLAVDQYIFELLLHT